MHVKRTRRITPDLYERTWYSTWTESESTDYVCVRCLTILRDLDAGCWFCRYQKEHKAELARQRREAHADRENL